MSSEQTVYRVGAPAGIGLGVLWYVWGLYGFWWGLLYGIGWPTWAGYRLAMYLLGGSQ